MIKILLICAGTLCVALGVIGIFLPLMPTTPFLLLAAACYVRSSPRLYEKLMSHKVFGPIIDNWRTYRSIPQQSKWLAMILIVISFSISIFLVIPNQYAKIAMAIMGVIGLVVLARTPTTESVLARQNSQQTETSVER